MASRRPNASRVFAIRGTDCARRVVSPWRKHKQSLLPPGTARAQPLGAPGDLRASHPRPALLYFFTVFREIHGRVEGHYAKPRRARGLPPKPQRRPTNPKRHGRATLSNGDKLGVKRQMETLKRLQLERRHPNASAQEYGLTHAGGRLHCFKRRLPETVVRTRWRIRERGRGVLHKAMYAGAF